MIRLPVTEESEAGAARRQAVALARQLGLQERSTDRLALIVTEIATNLWRHAERGELLLIPTAPGEKVGCEVIGIDEGPGIASVERALEDGFSTGGRTRRGIGGGLGAIRRLSERFDIHSDPGGTTVVATVAPGMEKAEAPAVAGLVVPKPGEEVAGDAWAVRRGADASLVMLVDVLGHGPKAAAVAEAALAAFREPAELDLGAAERAVTAALAGDRGAALLLCRVPHGPGPLTALGIGNLRGEVIVGGERRGLVSVAGIAGQAARTARPLDYPWGPDATLLLSTDGLRERPRRPEPPSMVFREPLTVAATLYARRRRGTDDCGVVVVRAG